MKTTQSKRAGITFPVGKIGRLMRCESKRVGAEAPVFMAAVMEYLCAEILEIAGEMCKESRKQRLIPRHIELAIRNDEDLARFYQNKTIAGGGMTPYINPCVLAKKK